MTCRAVFGVSLFLASASLAQPQSGQDWAGAEAPVLTNHVQITSRDMFVKAGEGYFSPDSRWIVFQATPVPPPGEEPAPFYSMYVARLVRDAGGHITGIEEPIMISAPGSANTCGWFWPKTPYRVLFGSTRIAPVQDQSSGFQVGSRRYVWLFPQEMDVVSRTIPQIYYDLLPESAGHPAVNFNADAEEALPVFPEPLPMYDAECSWSPDQTLLLYAKVRQEEEAERPDADIYLYNTITKTHVPIITADGYDGGPFFSPDATKICYRSDRKGDDHLQIFVAELLYDRMRRPTGIAREVQLTDDGFVNWGPYWHPSGGFLVYSSSGERHNYEIWAIEVDLDKPAGALQKRQITFASGADVLPVFNADGSLLMWTAQRGPLAEGEERPSSQLWAAEVVGSDWID